MVYNTKHKKMYRYKLLLVCGLLLLFACEKNEQDRSFYGDEKIFFAPDNNADSLVHSFANTATADLKDLELPLNIMGAIPDRDRTVTVVVDPSGTTALSAEYELGQAVVPAGSVTGYLPLRLINAPRLEAEQVELTLLLQSSPDFTVEPERPGELRELTRFRVIWTNILNRPSDWQSIWGGYSKVKHKLVIDLTGHYIYSGTEWTAGGYLYRVLGVCSQWIAEYNAAHPGDPYRDENGNQIGFCPSCH